MITQDQTTVFCEKCQSDSIPQLYFTFFGGGGFWYNFTVLVTHTGSFVATLVSCVHSKNLSNKQQTCKFSN